MLRRTHIFAFPTSRFSLWNNNIFNLAFIILNVNFPQGWRFSLRGSRTEHCVTLWIHNKKTRKICICKSHEIEILTRINMEMEWISFLLSVLISGGVFVWIESAVKKNQVKSSKICMNVINGIEWNQCTQRTRFIRIYVI